MKRRLLALVLCAACLPAAAAAECPLPAGASSGIAQPWPGLHRDSGNTDYYPLTSARALRMDAHVVPGPAILTAATIDAGGRVYVATGLGGNAANLLALNADGSIAWTRAGPDAGAALGSPVLDDAGDVYLADSDQLWAWRRSGALKWVVPIPAPVMSLVWIDANTLAAASLSGDVLLVDRADGRSRTTALALPGNAPAADTPPPGLWQGQYDPDIIAPLFAAFQGRGYLVTTTPAADPARGRLYVPTTDGFLYRIDRRSNTLQVGFQAPIGTASGASPALSPDANTVYVVDGLGVLYAIDSQSGARRWERALGETVGSPTVGADGSVYTLAGAELVSLSPGGAVRWRRDMRALAASLLPAAPTGWTAAGRPDSVITATPERLYVAVNAGFETLAASGQTLFALQKTVLLVVAPDNGNVLAAPLELPDTSDAVISLGNDGRAYVTHGSIASSVGFNTLQPYLPPALAVRPPAGGLSVLAPASFAQLAADRADQAGCALGRALDALGRRDAGSAQRALGFARAVTVTVPEVLAGGRREIDPAARQAAEDAVARALRWQDLAAQFAAQSGSARAAALARLCTAIARAILATVPAALG